MHVLDFIVPLVLVVAAIRGATRGFVLEFFSVAAIVMGLVGAGLFTDVWLPRDPTGVAFSSQSVVGGFLGVCSGIYLAVLLVGTLLSRVWMGGWRGVISRTAGALVSTAKWSFALVLMLLVLDASPRTTVATDVMGSRVAHALVDAVKRSIASGPYAPDEAREPRG